MATKDLGQQFRGQIRFASKARGIHPIQEERPDRHDQQLLGGSFPGTALRDTRENTKIRPPTSTDGFDQLQRLDEHPTHCTGARQFRRALTRIG